MKQESNYSYMKWWIHFLKYYLFATLVNTLVKQLFFACDNVLAGEMFVVCGIKAHGKGGVFAVDQIAAHGKPPHPYHLCNARLTHATHTQLTHWDNPEF